MLCLLVYAVLYIIVWCMSKYDFYKKALWKCTPWYLATPIFCTRKWCVNAMVFGVFPIRMMSTNYPWPYYAEESAREGIRKIRADYKLFQGKQCYED